MPVRLLTQSLLRWPEPELVLQAVRQWSQQEAQRCASLLKVGVYGSYGRGDAAVGSDLDLLLIDAQATGSQSQRYRQWPFEQLPLSCDALVLSPAELEQVLAATAHGEPAAAAMAQALQQDCRWIWQRHAEQPNKTPQKSPTMAAGLEPLGRLGDQTLRE